MATHAQLALPETEYGTGRYSGAMAKKRLIRKIQQDSLKKLSLASQAVLVRSHSTPYYVYHIQMTSDYYKQKWVVCKRYSEFYRLRKKILEHLKLHKTKGKCPHCSHLFAQLKDFDFPERFSLFGHKDMQQLVSKRTAGLEDFVIALCQYLSGEGLTAHCPEILLVQNSVKEFLQFPLEHERQHIRAIKSLIYVDPRDVCVDTESCPICLNDWGELDGNQLVQSQCGHFFHEHCINEWFCTRFDCPMCRQIAGMH